MLFGSKSTFGIEIEYENRHTDFGKVRLWLQGIYVGSINESQVVGVALHQINLLLQAEESIGLPSFNNEKDMFNYLENEQEKISITSFGEAFDDFDIYCFKKNNFITFYFKLCDEPFFEYPNYGNEIKSARIAIEYIYRVLNEIKS